MSLRPHVLAAILSGALAPVCAADFSSLQPEGYVSDFARVINPAHKAELERYCSRVEAQTGAQIALVTVPSLGGEPIEDVANGLFHRWGIGKKGNDEGVLLLFATGDRRMRMEVGYGLEPVIPDGYAGQVLDAMRPLLRQGEYGPALLEAAHTIGQRIAGAKGVQLDATLPSRRQPAGPDPRSLVGLVFPLVFFLLLLWMISRTRRPGGYYRHGGVFPIVFPGGWHGSGGGFGGYDSGDRFGGFGGGDSGGGGASSDW